jgi:hypothetical protein
MLSVTRLAARDVLLQPHPSLIIGQNHTILSAIHPVDYVGTLVPWPNFIGDVIAAFNPRTVSWNTQTLDVIISGIGAVDTVSQEQLVLGDETGLQGRLNERLSRPVTTCLQVQGHLLRVGDFKASSEAARYSRVPDLVVLDNGAATKVVGEVKTPWAPEHVDMLRDGVEFFEAGQEHQLRRVLGMYDMNYTRGSLY